MPHSKKPKLTHADTANMASSNASLNDLSADELAMIFGCLGPVNIMPLRRVPQVGRCCQEDHRPPDLFQGS